MSEEWLVASFDDDDWPIDYNHLKKIQDSDLGYVISDLHIKKIVQGQKLLELIEKRIEIHKETYDKLKNVLSPDDKGSMFKACQEDMLNELQKLLEDSKK